MNESLLTIERDIVHLGIRITENLSWDEHVAQICSKAYALVKMLPKLKYVGVQTKDLMEIYAIHIQSVTEYCSSAFHSSLSQQLSNKLEAIQKTRLRVILGVS